MLEKIRSLRYDNIIEKHEGPESWSATLKYSTPEFLRLGGYEVLLPIGQERHPNITLLRLVPSGDGAVLTLFLKDTTYIGSPADEPFVTGRLVICEQMPGTEFYVTTVYHEWFIFENAALQPTA
ncbi:MAG: hypothetical protein GYB65_24225 [Chloroflexi bacterium]|nr:hypothetical protein [Chloroflexota bacterium]